MISFILTVYEASRAKTGLMQQVGRLRPRKLEGLQKSSQIAKAGNETSLETPVQLKLDNTFYALPWHPFHFLMTWWSVWWQSESLLAEEGEKKEGPEGPGAAAHSPLSTQISDPDDFPGLETSVLLQHGDTVLHISENGMENPLLASQFTLTPPELGETGGDLDESHV